MRIKTERPAGGNRFGALKSRSGNAGSIAQFGQGGKKEMRFASVCSGIGVAESAWMPLGWQPTFFAEIEPFPCAALEHLYPDVPNLGDMTTINGADWRGRVDLLAGGTPCQAFSIAGNRKSLADERGNLTLKFVELCDAISPAFIVWENVPGVLSTPDNAFGCFLGVLAGEDGPLVAPGGRWSNAGYVLGPKRAIAWRVLDAQYFGVAQRRRRVFLVACPRGGADPREILFESDSVRRDSPPSREKGQAVAGTLDASLGRSRGAGTPMSALTTVCSQWDGGPHQSLSQSHNTGGIGMSNQELFSQKGAGLVADKWPAEVAPTLNAAFGSKMGLEDQHALGGAGLFVPHVAPPLTTSPHSDNAAEEEKLVIAFHGSQDHDVIGDVTHPVGRNWGRETCVAFQQNQPGEVRTGDVAGTLNTNSNPSGRNTPMAAIAENQRGEVRLSEISPQITCGGGKPGQGYPAVQSGMQVRRLTPRECERLQGLPDDYTLIPYRNKPAEQCPDGPRYKALGNAWNRAVVEWLGKRINNSLCAAGR